MIQKRLDKRLRPKEPIKKATNNLKNVKPAIYGLTSEQIQVKSLENSQFQEQYNFHRLEKVKLDAVRRNQSDKSNAARQRKKSRCLLDLGDSIYVLAERLKRKRTRQIEQKLSRKSTYL